MLRIDPELWRELERWAQDELRSVNAQIEFVLKQAVLRRKRAEAEEAGEAGGSAAASPHQTKGKKGA